MNGWFLGAVLFMTNCNAKATNLLQYQLIQLQTGRIQLQMGRIQSQRRRIQMQKPVI